MHNAEPWGPQPAPSAQGFMESEASLTGQGRKVHRNRLAGPLTHPLPEPETRNPKSQALNEKLERLKGRAVAHDRCASKSSSTRTSSISSPNGAPKPSIRSPTRPVPSHPPSSLSAPPLLSLSPLPSPLSLSSPLHSLRLSTRRRLQPLALVPCACHVSPLQCLPAVSLASCPTFVCMRGNHRGLLCAAAGLSAPGDRRVSSRG